MYRPAREKNKGVVELVLVLIIAVITASLLFILFPSKKDFSSKEVVLGGESEQVEEIKVNSVKGKKVSSSSGEKAPFR